MSDNTQKPKYILDKYKNRITVGAKEFYSDGRPFKRDDIFGQLSAKMLRIYKIISATAIDRLNEKKFIEFYNKKELEQFHGAMLSRIYSPDNGPANDDEKNDEKAIGFLFTAFYSRKDKGTGKPLYIGMAFPGIKFEERTKEKNRAEWNRQDFYKMFLGFYLKQIFTVLKEKIDDKHYKNHIEPLQGRIDKYDITKTPMPDGYPEDVRTVIGYLKEKKIKVGNKKITIPDMQIEAYAENPLTYKDFCEFEFNYNVKPPSKEFEEMSKNWSVADLLHYSYIESNNPNPPVFLEKDLEFTVNLTPLEWRKYFEIAINRNSASMKYYLWQNFNFPNTAFKVIIPLNAENFWKVAKGSSRTPSTFSKEFIDEINKILK